MRPTYDNWASTLSSLGSIKDKSVGAEFRRRARLTRYQVEALVDQNQICARVVYKPVAEAFRPGWRFRDDALEPFRERLERELHASERVETAAGWARLYGACGLVLPVVDGRKPHQPLNPRTVRSVLPPTPIPAHQIEPLTYDAAFGSPTYREVLMYRVQSLSTRVPQHDVDASRVIVFEPIKLPIDSRIEQLGLGVLGWGPSVLQRIYDELVRYGTARARADAMMYTASVLVLYMEHLSEQATTQGGREAIRANLQLINECMDSLGIAGLDGKDRLENVAHSFAGVPEVIAANESALAQALPFPREIGMNESPNGLRGGELSGAQALFFSDVDAWRRREAEPALLRIARLAATAWGVEYDSLEIEWGDLWVPDEQAQSELAERNSRTDRTYYEIGALGAKEARTKRFVNGERGAITVEPEAEHEVRKTSPYLAPALEIVKAVEAGEIPRDSGHQMLLGGGFSPLWLGSAGIEEPIAVTLERDDP